jgi:[protein-PII] uridylyltransferase
MSQATNTSDPEYQLDLNPERRREFIASLNEQLERAREELTRTCCPKGGVASCARFSAAMDEILQAIYYWLAAESKLRPPDYERLVIVAQGGYGRMELNLHSDVDLLFLIPDSATPLERAFVKSFLYALWDLYKVDIGYATKRLHEALLAVGTDLDSTTALIEVRLVAGSRDAFDALTSKLFTLLHGQNQKWFITSKLAEWNNRREKYGSSVYLLEPNVKDGEGGLRDVHSMEWLSYVLLGSSDLQTLVKRNLLTGEELAAVNRAMDFLLCIRTVLHSSEGRKVDVLTFDKQPAVARTLGYTSDDRFLAEERMMRDYYQHARTIDRYSQKVTRMLTSRARSIIGGVFEAIRRKSVNSDYFVKDGILFLKMPTAEFFRRDVDRIMECFWIATQLGVTLSEELKDVLMEAHAAIDTEKFQHSKRCRDLFIGILGQKQHVASTMHAMHETEILGDYIPEFQKLFCVARIDHYHKYTVDEHLVKTIEISEGLISAAPGERQELVVVAQEIERWDLLNLSLLLHDIGKGEGHGHVLRGGILSQKITQRMGLPPEDQEVVRQLILQHLKMVHISQRRDLEDPHVIAEVAQAVGDVEMLRLLYVLTYCDTRAVGPNAWTDWKAILLHSLYQKTRLFLEGKHHVPTLDAQAQERLIAGVVGMSGDEANEEETRAFVTNASQKYLSFVSPRKMARHIAMIRELSPDTNRIVWEIDDPEHYNYTELTAVSYDVPGFMSYVCGALSSKDINILSVQAFSTKDGYAIDAFQVTDLRGNKLPHGFRLDRLRNDLNAVLLGKAKPEEKFPSRRRGREVHADLAAIKPSRVIVDNDASPEFTVLEIKTFDRPGLLYDITSTSARQGYYIHLAMITTEAYRVVDVFYITDLEFNKLEPPQMKKLKAAVEEVVS